MPRTKRRRIPIHLAGVSVRGFKSIHAEQHLEIAPLTVLAGANSSGKSSFLQPLLLMKQTLEAPGDPGALALSGPNVRFTSAEQVLWRESGKKQAESFEVDITLSNQASLGIEFKKVKGQGFNVACMTWCSGDHTIRLMPSMSEKEILGVLPKWAKEIDKSRSTKDQWIVRRQRCFLTFDLKGSETTDRRYLLGPSGLSPSDAWIPQLTGIIHLPGLRGNPLRNYPKTAPGPWYQGTFEQYAASILAQWQVDQSAKLDEVARNLQEMGLTWKIEARPVDDANVEIRVGRLPRSRRGGAHDLVNIADVGFGVSQSLPVVVALVAAKPGQLVYLEQPEIHLHPRAQRSLARIIYLAVERGVIVVVETHSALLVKRIQTLIAEGEIDLEKVRLHWVQRDDAGHTTISTAQLDRSGTTGDWPGDFDEIELEAEHEYLDAVEQREADE